MIKVDAKNNIFDLNGGVPRLLVELEYIVADIYTKMVVSELIDEEVAERLLEESKEYGIERAKVAIKEVREEKYKYHDYGN